MIQDKSHKHPSSDNIHGIVSLTASFDLQQFHIPLDNHRSHEVVHPLFNRRLDDRNGSRNTPLPQHLQLQLLHLILGGRGSPCGKHLQQYPSAIRCRRTRRLLRVLAARNLPRSNPNLLGVFSDTRTRTRNVLFRCYVGYRWFDL